MAFAAAIPFSREAFLQVFEDYNQAVWPAQVVLFVFALASLALVFHDRGWARGMVYVILGGLWLWMGIVYHLLFFTAINVAAWGFGALFIVQAGLLFLAALGDGPRESRAPLSRGFGAVLLVYALAVYPMVGALLGHDYPREPTFGLPCPTTIFTFGILLLTCQHVPWWLFVIPSLWALVGASAPFQWGIWEDLGLVIAAVISVAIVIAHSRRGAAAVRLAA